MVVWFGAVSAVLKASHRTAGLPVHIRCTFTQKLHQQTVALNTITDLFRFDHCWKHLG